MGDVKMLAMIGAFLGWKAVLVTLILSSFAGALVGLGIIAFTRGSMRLALPFGTFLSLGALAAMLVGDPLVTGTGVLRALTGSSTDRPCRRSPSQATRWSASPRSWASC